MSQTIHGDFSVRVVVDTKTLPWTPSPSGTGWRKRLHLVGPTEFGQVTSIVRYQENAHFRRVIIPRVRKPCAFGSAQTATDRSNV